MDGYNLPHHAANTTNKMNSDGYVLLLCSLSDIHILSISTTLVVATTTKIIMHKIQNPPKKIKNQKSKSHVIFLGFSDNPIITFCPILVYNFSFIRTKLENKTRFV